MAGAVYLVASIGLAALSIGSFVRWTTYGGPPVADNAKLERAPEPSFQPCARPPVYIGMSKAELLEKCGPASSISHQLIGADMDKEQWAYKSPGSYVYLTNGIVTSMQYAENGERFTWENR